LALAEADGKPRVAAPSNMTAPSKNETTVFMINFSLSKLQSLASAFRNDHASAKISRLRPKRTAGL
jgi:hypothetical protein